MGLSITAVRGVFTLMEASPSIPKMSCVWNLNEEINKHYSNMTSSFVSLPPWCRSRMEIQAETAGSSPEWKWFRNSETPTTTTWRSLTVQPTHSFSFRSCLWSGFDSSGGHFFSMRTGSESFWTCSSFTSSSTQTLNRGSGSWKTNKTVRIDKPQTELGVIIFQRSELEVSLRSCRALALPLWL